MTDWWFSMEVGDQIAFVSAAVAVVALVATAVSGTRSKAAAKADREAAETARNTAQDHATSAKDQAEAAAEHVEVAKQQVATAREQAEATKEQAEASRKSAETAEESLKVMDRIARAMERLGPNGNQADEGAVPIWRVECTWLMGPSTREFTLRNVSGVDAVALDLKFGAGAWGSPSRKGPGGSDAPALLPAGGMASFYVLPHDGTFPSNVAVRALGYEYADIPLPTQVGHRSEDVPAVRAQT